VTVSSSPEDLTGTDFGYFAGSISGLVSNDLNGDGVVDPGEPPAAGWTLTLSGPLSRTTQSDSTGAYLFGGLKPGSYSVQVENRAGWIHTWPGAPGDAPASLDSLNPSRTGIDFANFQLVTISGLMFDDANRNGTRDLAEGVLTNRTVTLTKGLSNVNTLTDGGGNYHFSGVSGGTYTVTQTGPPGYNQSYPAPPGTHEITTYSGEAVPGRNFGNFQSVQNSIVVRCLGDNDGDFSTLADATTKPWTLKLYLNAVGGTPLTPASATTSSIYFSNLAAGTYYAVIADSAGWTRLGSVVDGVPTAGTETTAVVVHSLGEAHQVNMIVFRPNSLLVRAWSDADGRFATAADRDTLTWDLSVYRKFVAPANLVASAAGVESLLVENLGNGTYIAVEGDSAGWKHLGTIPGDSGSSNNRSVSLSGGSSATVEFVNTEVGSIAVAALTDEDGFAATDTDRAPIAWRLRAYRDAEAPENLVRDDSSSGLLLSNLAVGTYVVTQTTTQGGSAWSQVGTILDGVMDSTIKTSKATIILATGESRTVGFVNFDPRRKKTWTAAEDGEWNNARNWNPQFIPRPIDTVVIAPTALACIPEMPRGLSFPSLTVAADGALSFAGDDTLRRDLRVDGSLVADADSTSVLTVGRNWDGSGSFIPGSSLADFPRGIVHTVSGMDFHDLRLDTNTTGTPSNLRATGNVRVSGTFSLLGSFDAGNDTLFILSDRPEAIADSGTVVAGALNRAIRTDTTGLAYRFESESTYVAFADTARIPAEVAMRVYRSTPASSFADAWEVIGINPRRSPGSVAVDSVTRLSRFRAITLGRIIAGKPTPTVNRVYSAHAEGDSGFTATLSLAYAAGEVVGIPSDPTTSGRTTSSRAQSRTRSATARTRAATRTATRSTTVRVTG
jgi:uncharacterized protein (DUF2141 family)